MKTTDPLLEEFDAVIAEHRKDALEAAEDLRGMYREDADDLQRVRDLVDAGEYGAAADAAWKMDTAPREYIPERLWDVISSARVQGIKTSKKRPMEVYRVLRREELKEKAADLEAKLAACHAELKELGE